MKNPITDFSEQSPRWRQFLLRLTRIVTIETRRRLVLIPDRMSAENERDKLKRQHGAAMIAADIRKQGKGKSGTYTLAYTLRESREEVLF
ncbi:MAG: hypothetical protein U1F83_10320 [Verrucomicrobiota bacterium]